MVKIDVGKFTLIEYLYQGGFSLYTSFIWMILNFQSSLTLLILVLLTLDHNGSAYFQNYLVKKLYFNHDSDTNIHWLEL